MKVAIDISPLSENRLLSHRVRGTGFYIENLKKSLLKYYPQNKYIFFNKEEKVPSDLDLIHYPYFEPFFLTLPIRKKFKTVVTVHDLTPLVFPEHFPSGIKGELKWVLQKYSLQKADAVIADSICSKKDIIRYAKVPEDKIHVVYLAAGEEFKKMEKSSILGSIRKKYNLPDKFVLYVGDVTWNKNLPRLIEAVMKINVPLVMVGKALIEKNFDRNNPWNQDLVKVQELANDDKRIIRLGLVPTEDLVSIYSLATVFVMPSLYEGFGLPILEAMSCGCPVVASKGGSLAEVVGEAGRYIDSYDIDSIAKGISEVFNSASLQKELSQKGIIQSKKFTWKKTADETMSVYKSVV